MPTVILKTLSGRARTGMSLWGAIRCLTLGEMLQGSAELAAVLSLLVAATYLVHHLVQAKFRGPCQRSRIHVRARFHTGGNHEDDLLSYAKPPLQLHALAISTGAPKNQHKDNRFARMGLEQVSS